MHKQSIHLLKTLLALLASVLFAGCLGPSPKMIPSITSFSVDGKPIIQPRLGKILIVPFSNDKFIDTYELEWVCSDLQEEFKDNLETLLRTPGLFGYSDKYVINVKAELVSMRNLSGASTSKYEGTMKYEFSTKNGTILLTEKIISQGNDNTFDGIQRIKNVCHNTALNNIALLSKVLKTKLPNVWQAYAEKQETVRRKIAANLKKENRYFRVLESSAVIREQPDADAKVVVKLSQADQVYVTGSLPSGWVQVSREGKTIGWVHRSLLGEHFASPPSQKPVEPPKVTITPTLAHATQADVTSTVLDFGSYHALIVGNNDYRHLPKLRTAVNDAKAMAVLLQDKYGFELQLLLNATRADILRAINGYRRTLGQRDNLLIYYAGHGWLDEDADQGYWLPVDATGQDPTNWISNGAITDALRAMEAKHVLVIADSCYSGKLARGINVRIRTKNYYEKISRKKARSVMASGGLEPVADEGGKGIHSAFASALIEALNENQGVLDGTLLFSQIRRPVMLNSDQTPEYSDIRKAGHDGGDFLFVRQKR